MKNIYIMIDENTCEMTLTRGQKCLIDAHDMALIGEYKWYAALGRTPNIYYVHCTLPRVNGKQKALKLRLIMCIMDPKVKVDHIDGNPLNNRKSNLRVATHTENTYNQRTRKNSTTGLKDITWDKRKKKYLLKIQANGKRKSYGHFTDLNAAIIMRNQLLPLLHGEFANTKDQK